MTADQSCNRAFERLAAGVAALNPGVVIDNGPTPKLGEVRNRCDAIMKDRPYHGWHRDDYTGFDDPILRKLPRHPTKGAFDSMRRTFSGGVRIMYNFIAKTAAESDVIYFSNEGHGTGSTTCIWMDDLYYADWFAYQRTAWTKARDIDARLLSNEEVLALKILTEAVIRFLHGSTRVTPIIRCTLEQVYFLTEWDSNPNRWGFISQNFKKFGQLDDGPAEYFRQQAPADLVTLAKRILDMTDVQLAGFPQTVLDHFQQMRAARNAYMSQPKMKLIPSDDHDIPDQWVESED